VCVHTTAADPKNVSKSKTDKRESPPHTHTIKGRADFFPLCARHTFFCAFAAFQSLHLLLHLPSLITPLTPSPLPLSFLHPSSHCSHPAPSSLYHPFYPPHDHCSSFFLVLRGRRGYFQFLFCCGARELRNSTHTRRLLLPFPNQGGVFLHKSTACAQAAALLSFLFFFSLRFCGGGDLHDKTKRRQFFF
jgi:hypothetical protein